MLHLFMDTATERGVIGLSSGAELIESIDLPVGLMNAQFLFPALIELLQRKRFTPEHLKLISAGVGPGSYTGMRVAAATAQSLSFALKLPLVGFSTLEAFAPEEPGSFAVILDAKYGGVYLSQGKLNGESILHEPPIVLSVEEAMQLQVEHWITPHATPKLSQAFPRLKEQPPSAHWMAKLAFQKYQQGHFTLNGELKLLYLRKTQAEQGLKPF